MASQVLQPLDEFRVGLRNRLDATLRSELLHTGAMQADERHRELVYAEWWRYRMIPAMDVITGVSRCADDAGLSANAYPKECSCSGSPGIPRRED